MTKITQSKIKRGYALVDSPHKLEGFRMAKPRMCKDLMVDGIPILVWISDGQRINTKKIIKRERERRLQEERDFKWEKPNKNQL